MPTPPLSLERAQETVEAWHRNGHNITYTAREIGISRQQVRYHIIRAGALHVGATDALSNDDGPIVAGRIEHANSEVLHFPRNGGVQRFIITSAQNNTHLFEPFWRNLLALKKHWDAELLVSRFTYNKAAFGVKARKPGSVDASDVESLWYDEAIKPFICDLRVQLADGLVFCGELNLLPTLVNPISGLETYTGPDSCILPHTKIALRSVPTGKAQPAKFIYSTGAVTLRNYVARKEGQKADFHHAFGASLVEVDEAGDWFVRQLNADSEGTVFDLDIRARDGRVTTGHRVEAINWGDLHVAEREAWTFDLAFDEGGVLDTLRPRYQFMHDILDFKARDIHVSKYNAWHSKFRDWVEGYSEVEAEIREVALFLAHEASRSWVETVIVNSNHNRFLDIWLQRDDFRRDPGNAIFWLKLQLAAYEHYKQSPLEDFNSFDCALRMCLDTINTECDGLTVLARDESFIICNDASGGIECGMHGDDGPNGARGTPMNLSRIGRKSNTGHTHSATITDGCYVAGVLAKLDQRYNSGPSSWSHSQIVTYENGKRSIITFWNGKWRA